MDSAIYRKYLNPNLIYPKNKQTKLNRRTLSRGRRPCVTLSLLVSSATQRLGMKQKEAETNIRYLECPGLTVPAYLQAELAWVELSRPLEK